MEYYKYQAKKWLCNQSRNEYIITSLNVCKNEEDKIHHFFSKYAFEALHIQIAEVLIKVYEENKTEKDKSEYYLMFKDKRLDELRNIYTLFKKIPESLTTIVKEMQEYICERCNKIKNNKDLNEDPVKFINEFIELKREFYLILDAFFERNLVISQGIDFGFHLSFKDYDTFPKYLASYADFQLSVGLKEKENLQEELFNNILYFVTCLSQKDIFLSYHSRFLANRLLNNTSLSRDSEALLISKLIESCDYNNVYKLQSIVRDINLSMDLQSEFQSSNISKEKKIPEMSLKILSLTNWPVFDIVKFSLPNLLLKCAQNFETFYYLKAPGKKLFWLFSQGNCELKTNYLSKPYYLITSVFQYAILEQFNFKDSIMYCDLSNIIQLSQDIITNNLKDLYKEGRQLILKDNVKELICEPNESLKINLEFSHSTLKINLIPMSSKEDINGTKNEEMATRINKQRELIVDCIIVRIMKINKVLNYNSIIEKVFQECNLFKPDPSFIKQQIESLFEREFLKRDENDRNTIIYCP